MVDPRLLFEFVNLPATNKHYDVKFPSSEHKRAQASYAPSVPQKRMSRGLSKVKKTHECLSNNKLTSALIRSFQEVKNAKKPNMKQSSRKVSQPLDLSIKSEKFDAQKGVLPLLGERTFALDNRDSLENSSHLKRRLTVCDELSKKTSKLATQRSCYPVIPDQQLATLPKAHLEAKMTKINHHPENNLLGTLKRVKTKFLVDDSASMSLDGKWEAAKKVLGTLVDTASKYETGGVEVDFLNYPKSLRSVKDKATIIKQLKFVQPVGESTPIEVKVEMILHHYLEKLEYVAITNKTFLKPLNLIILTDGITDDVDSLIWIIRETSSRLDAAHFRLNQIGIQFVIIGDESCVARVLRVLDDQLQTKYGVSRDMVDVTRFLGKTTNSFVIKCLLGGIDRDVRSAIPGYRQS
ncbi:hypothetical protein O181_018417 [Austropuccinia psidii MF-1]|uniref:VWFA domain-containing protein n=1 Tax=Austropuccinia psidii MF-1 TaxID=1389203 RepID=A0A9Q3C7U4_9BASI|nr:hypothetical protein [Austropuccinia psidii MF-1]